MNSPANDHGNIFYDFHFMTYLKHVIKNNYTIGEDGEDDDVILEVDSEDEEGYVFAGHGNFLMFQLSTCIYIAHISWTHVVN
jgi:hypothetical protein